MRAAKISITNLAAGSVRQTVTEASGRYEAPALPAGDYAIRAAKPGFADEVRGEVHRAAGQIAAVGLALERGAAAQAIAVESDAPIVGPSTADMSGVVWRRMIQDLPLNGRGYHGIDGPSFEPSSVA